MKRLMVVMLMFFCFSIRVNASTSSAYEYILMDMNSGRVLSGKNYNTPVLIASITKIMTCVLAIESNKLDDMVKVTDVIRDAYGSGIYIEVGEEISLRDLLYGLMLRSGNDAALMVADYVGGDVDNFVLMMNSKAREIGMVRTNFVNPSGLDNSDRGNYSTAYDMAILTKYAMMYEEYRKIVKTKSYVVKTNKKTYSWKNKNKLLKERYITGGKTGYTDKARRTLVSTGSSDGLDLIVVTLRDSDDWNTHKELYQYAFQNFNSYMVMNKGMFKVIGDDFYKDKLYIKNDIYLTLDKNKRGDLVGKIMLEKKNKYKDNDRVGEYLIFLGDELLHKEPIYVKKKSGLLW